MSPQWETVEVPRGAFVSWGNKTGQQVVGKVLDYDPVGGTDFNSNTCPRLALELIEEAASFNRDGDRTDHGVGEIVQINAGQVSLRRALRAADPAPGDLVKITLANLVKTANGTVKEFDFQIARNAKSDDKPADDQKCPF